MHPNSLPKDPQQTSLTSPEKWLLLCLIWKKVPSGGFDWSKLGCVPVSTHVVQGNGTSSFEPNHGIPVLHMKEGFPLPSGKYCWAPYNLRFPCILLWIFQQYAPHLLSSISTFKNIIHNNYHTDSEVYTPLLWCSNSASISMFRILQLSAFVLWLGHGSSWYSQPWLITQSPF